MYTKLLSYTPIQVFLAQGDEGTLYSLEKEFIEKKVSIEKIKLSRFTIEDARALVRFNIERSGETWCIVYFDIFVNDAAQVLLKTLEEPRKGTHIVFITPHPYMIPQTVRSRVLFLPGSYEKKKPKTIPSVLNEIKKEIESKDEDASLRRAKALTLLDDLEMALSNDKTKSQLLYEAKDMLYRANLPVKFVLEYLGALFK